MPTKKKLHIGMSLAPTWLSGEAWRRADSGVEGLYGSAFYVDIARRSEKAFLDFAFLPDSQFLNTQALATAPGFASLDPTVLLASVAQETSHIGLLSTASTTFLHPYTVARQIMSLHAISKGRAGWNIVTALDGQGNFGLEKMPSPEDRYARAAEFTDIVRQLWQSYPAKALKLDKQSGLFADAAQVHPINHEGGCFSVAGPLNLPAFDGDPIPLVQAGASQAGRAFAAAVADAIFASTPDVEAAAELRKDLRHRASGHGRAPDSIRVLPGLSLYLADTVAEAQDLFARTHARLDRSRGIATVLEMTGLDLTDWPADRVVRIEDLPPAPENVRSRTHAGLLRRLIERESLRVDALLVRPEVIGSAHWQIVGTVGQAVDEIRTWVEREAIDGFVSVPGGSVTCMHLFLEQLMPALTDDGLFRKAYNANTFYGHLTEM